MENTRVRGQDNPSCLNLILTESEDSANSVEYCSPLGSSDHCILTWSFVVSVGFEMRSPRKKCYFHLKINIIILITYPNTYIALYSRTPKLPVTHTHTHPHKNKKLLYINLKLVPSLAKLPCLVTPFPLGGTPPTPITIHSSNDT